MQAWKFPISIALLAVPAMASSFFFSTGSTDGRLGAASRPSSTGIFEIETGDDFILSSPTDITGATFVGLAPSGASFGEVRAEIYRVFPNDSNVGRTGGPPLFQTPEVPTRVNSPGDVEFSDRDTASSNLLFSTTVLAGNFTASNSVVPGGIHAIPGQTTSGNGAVTGEEVEFDLTFSTPIDLPAGHYFFVPQVEVTSGGDFFWLSAPRPIVGGTGPFLPDLQAWTRDQFLAPDWLRVGTDIVGGTTFNMTFSLSGETVPEPASCILLGGALLALAAAGRKKLTRGRAHNAESAPRQQ